MAKGSKIIRLNQQIAKEDDEILRLLHLSAQRYEHYRGMLLMFIYRANKSAPYCYYEAYFGMENMMHLAGFKRRRVITSSPDKKYHHAHSSINARQFYERCLDGSLKLKEVRFTEDRKITSSKLDALPKLLQFDYVKIYQMGDADLIRLDNKFEIGLGNYDGIMGFDKRKSNSEYPVPVTVMDRSINDFVSNPQNVIAILMRKPEAPYYDTLVGCVSNGLLISAFPEEIQRKISPDFKGQLTLHKKKDS